MEATIHTKSNTRLKLKDMIKIALLATIAVVIMLFEIPLGFAPSFYMLDFSEVIVLIGAFAMGPLAGILIELLKVLLNLVINGTITAGVGELANFLIGCSLVVPAAYLYRRKKCIRNAVLGLAAGTVLMAAVGGMFNAFVLLPAYAAAFQMPIDALVNMGQKINPSITGLGTFVLWAVVPFNLLKGVISGVLTMLLYKRLSPVLHR